MKGLIPFRIYDNKLEYRFTLKRNITILQGESGIGKTLLLQSIFNASQESSSAAWTVETSANYFVYTSAYNTLNWKHILFSLEDTVIFIEENNRFVYSVEFANYVKNSGNYFVFIGRRPIKTLPYSWQEIYTLSSKKSSNSLRRVYEFKELYHNFPFINTDFDLIITEDSKSGYQFFSRFFNGIKVISAGGAANVLNTVMSENARNILCIVDGAAFGSYLQDYYNGFEENSFLNKRITLWLPESFEWVLLKAGVISFVTLAQVLENPSEYIECKDYVSWERFFTHLAEENSDPKWKYTKGELDPYYYSEKNQEKVKSVMPKELQSIKKNEISNGVKSMSLF